jgi:hypothetical protein
VLGRRKDSGSCYNDVHSAEAFDPALQRGVDGCGVGDIDREVARAAATRRSHLALWSIGGRRANRAGGRDPRLSREIDPLDGTGVRAAPATAAPHPMPPCTCHPNAASTSRCSTATSCRSTSSSMSWRRRRGRVGSASAVLAEQLVRQRGVHGPGSSPSARSGRRATSRVAPNRVLRAAHGGRQVSGCRC